MSLAGRLYGLARANLGALLRRDKDAASGDLEEFSDDELASELALRQQRRRRQDEARSSREAAERAARERADKAEKAGAGGTSGARARSSGASAAANAATAQSNAATAQSNAATARGAATSAHGSGARAQASAAGARASGAGAPGNAAGAQSTGGGNRGGANGASSSRPPETAASLERRRVAALYAELDSPEGADLDAVKKNFRRLMRKYHPDFNGTTPDELRVATDRTTRITTAYAELERLLAKK